MSESHSPRDPDPLHPTEAHFVTENRILRDLRDRCHLLETHHNVKIGDSALAFTANFVMRFPEPQRSERAYRIVDGAAAEAQVDMDEGIKHWKMKILDEMESTEMRLRNIRRDKDSLTKRNLEVNYNLVKREHDLEAQLVALRSDYERDTTADVSVAQERLRSLRSAAARALRHRKMQELMEIRQLLVPPALDSLRVANIHRMMSTGIGGEVTHIHIASYLARGSAYAWLLLGGLGKELSEIGGTLRRELVGQRAAIREIMKILHWSKSKGPRPRRPFAALLLTGDEGAGKGTTAEIIAGIWTGSRYPSDENGIRRYPSNKDRLFKIDFQYGNRALALEVQNLTRMVKYESYGNFFLHLKHVKANTPAALEHIAKIANVAELLAQRVIIIVTNSGPGAESLPAPLGEIIDAVVQYGAFGRLELVSIARKLLAKQKSYILDNHGISVEFDDLVAEVIADKALERPDSGRFAFRMDRIRRDNVTPLLGELIPKSHKINIGVGARVDGRHRMLIGHSSAVGTRQRSIV
jgi:ATP-dependent Clp protease ATP-binding subunit ClpA